MDVWYAVLHVFINYVYFPALSLEMTLLEFGSGIPTEGLLKAWSQLGVLLGDGGKFGRRILMEGSLHRGCVLKGAVLSPDPSPLSLLPGCHEVSSPALPHVPSHEGLPRHRPKVMGPRTRD